MTGVAMHTNQLSGPLACAFMDLPDVSEEVKQLIFRYINGEGVVVGWGLCRDGELGTGFRGNLITPLMIGGLDKPLRIGCSSMSSVWLGTQGKAITMGCGTWGQLGVPDLKKCPFVTSTEDGVPISVMQIELPDFNVDDMLLDVKCGYSFVAALSCQGKMFLWGSNVYAQCVSNLGKKNCTSPTQRSIPGEKIVEIGCSNYTVFALTARGVLYGWGCTTLLGDVLQIQAQASKDELKTVNLDNVKRTVVLVPVKVNFLKGKSIVHIRAGPWHAAVIDDEGKVYTWGVGKNGRLGHGDEEDVVSPKAVALDSKVVEVACGSFHTCFVTADGSAFLCGDNQGGQCGVLGEKMITTCRRVAVPSHNKVISASCGRHHTLLLMETGEIIAYGTGLGLGVGMGCGMYSVHGVHIMDNYTTLWMTSGTSHNFALVLPKLMTMLVLGFPHRGVAAALERIDVKEGLLCAGLGQGFSVFVSRRGSCYTMGVGGWGQLGTDLFHVKDHTPEGAPVMRHAMRVTYLSRTIITQVSAGISFVMALSDSHRVFAWGNNVYGQCGIGVDPKLHPCLYEPHEVTWLAEKLIIQVECGYFFSLALSVTGNVYAWGSIECCGNGLQPLSTDVPKNIIMNSLGPDSAASILLPVKVASLTSIVAVAAGAWHALALNSSGEIYAWGVGAYGRLGIGTEEDRYIPTKIALSASIMRIGCGPFGSFGISDCGKLYVWGANDKRQLSTTCSRVSSPTCVLDDVKEAALGKNYALALTRSGEFKFSGMLEYESGVYKSDSFNNTENLPPQLKSDYLKAKGFRGVRVFAGVEHAIVLVEKDPLPSKLITSAHRVMQNQPAEIVKRIAN